MIWNPWKHLRLAGALIAVVGACINQVAVSLIGLMIQYLGVVAGLDLTERRIARLEEQLGDKNENNS